MFDLGSDVLPTEYLSGWCDDDQGELAVGLTQAALRDGVGDDDVVVLPGDDVLVPGVLLAVLLEKVDQARLDGHELVRLLRARERQIAHLQAGSMGDVVGISNDYGGDGLSACDRVAEQEEFVSDEIRAALHLTRRAAQNRHVLAVDVVERLPRLYGMFRAGLLDLARVRVIAEGTEHLPESEARAVVDEIADRAPRLTTGQISAWIRRLCVDVDTGEAEARYENAVDSRRLWVEQTNDGTANVFLFDIPAEKGWAIARRVGRHQKTVDPAGRTADQVRADIAADLLLGSDPTNGGKGYIELKVDLTTLAGLDERGAEIAGFGPVVAEVARKIAEEQPRAEWRTVVTREDGSVATVVVNRRRPNKGMSRQVQVTNPTCTFPGCRVPSSQCDLDHLRPWSEGGGTFVENLGPKCRHDHRLKDHGWVHRHLNGRENWTSPLGHTYVTEPQPP